MLLTRLTQKNVPFEWSTEYDTNFLTLKALLTSSKIRTLSIEVHRMIIYYDAFGVCLAYVNLVG